MRKNKQLLIALILILVTSVTSQAQILPTQLQVTVIDGLGNFVEGADVSLYATQKDYQDSKNAVATGVTDAKGRVKFKDLKVQAYFIDARTEEQNNDGEGVQTGVLTKGRLNKVNTVIE